MTCTAGVKLDCFTSSDEKDTFIGLFTFLICTDVVPANQDDMN